MVQRTVLKVDLSCSKCKKKLLKAVSALEGKIIYIELHNHHHNIHMVLILINVSIYY